ncbi:hypothetical protein PSQ40_13155 [Curvibacter sp. HBC61]|uniref:Uncharacterized protein n=1 Tax=Curvibacter cyanobacteriorum TaxID=3026422 RepID=A0ABT5N1X4_9BURK|nr:hypothetical protein [Curvibacter sp. HBC61]MDD0839526.1 hypothetical protein [Curvibacter sp. HBC61]
MAFKLSRVHRTRLMGVWRSAGWPCKDGLEIDLLAAGLIQLHTSAEGHETLKLTDAGIQALAEARQRSQRALSAHDRLAQRFAEHLLGSGRIVWRELALRAALEAPSHAPSAPLTSPTISPTASPAEGTAPSPADTAVAAPPQAAEGPAEPASSPAARLWSDSELPMAPAPAPHTWRMARPDLFSVRNTSVARYLQPMVHEIKFSRADLLSDLRHAAKREAYEWLCEACYYVFPAGVAKANEIPEHLGIWLLHGPVESGQFELLRPARHQPCTLPFAVWMALSKASPVRSEAERSQARLGEGGEDDPEADPLQAPEGLL